MRLQPIQAHQCLCMFPMLVIISATLTPVPPLLLQQQAQQVLSLEARRPEQLSQQGQQPAQPGIKQEAGAAPSQVFEQQQPAAPPVQQLDKVLAQQRAALQQQLAAIK